MAVFFGHKRKRGGGPGQYTWQKPKFLARSDGEETQILVPLGNSRFPNSRRVIPRPGAGAFSHSPPHLQNPGVRTEKRAHPMPLMEKPREAVSHSLAHRGVSCQVGSTASRSGNGVYAFRPKQNKRSVAGG